jgi:hypothetical protein
MKRPLGIALWAVAAALFALALWLTFRNGEPGTLALRVIGKTNALGRAQTMLLLTNGTGRNYRIVAANVERYAKPSWVQDSLAIRSFKPSPFPFVLSTRCGLALTSDLPEPKARQRFTIQCIVENSRLEDFVQQVRSLLLRDTVIRVDTLTAEVEP